MVMKQFDSPDESWVPGSEPDVSLHFAHVEEYAASLRRSST